MIVLISILSAIAIPRFTNLSSYETVSLRNSVLGSLKLAQKVALAQHAGSVYWVLQRTASDRWQISILLDQDTSDAVTPADVTPPQLKETIPGEVSLSYQVSLAAGGNVSGVLGTDDNLVVMYDPLGNMIRARRNVSLSVAADFPGAAQTVNSSLQFNDSRKDFCLSLSGYAYEASCR